MGSVTLRIASCALFFTAFSTWGYPSYAQSLVQDFDDLFERCRASIETSSVFDSEGLQRRNVPERHARDWGVSLAQEAWGVAGAELYVLLTEWTSRDGTIRRLCEIRLANEESLLGPGEQAMLLRQFLILQVELIGAGTHEIDNQLSPIPPLVNAAFRLLDRNPNGCIVSNSFAFSPDGRFFSAGSGEQALEPCRAE
ncbi:hypothetical protein SAMN05216376_11786 [Mameliella alba]|uniref:hypothetical protein n=1 Tax=Mameliella alba TaxID=561184 RepID=UPI00087DFE86|nr:hypothetical protein [Mameliella alba]PTR35833.1 hypothetical protein LX94_04475 [Mameliella alba]SDE09457.1 hypothetical protein SAMN05216376_11786 [Mameliella alba]